MCIALLLWRPFRGEKWVRVAILLPLVATPVAVDLARADQFLSAVRPLPTAERALVAMGVAALATHAISRRGRLIRGG